MNWVRVTAKAPCPVCRRPDWCGVSSDGRFAVCMRVPSDQPTRNGGYLHKLFIEVRDPPPPRKRFVPPPAPPRDFADMMEAWTRNTPQDALGTLAASLGVSVSALAEIGAARASRPAAWAFPMRDGYGRTVGVRLRGDNGDKWAVKGSKEGLFYPESVPPDHVAIVCEGPTDTAAVLTLGLWAVGRPSCMGAIDHVRRLCRRLCVTHLVVMADNDRPKPRPGGGWWQPGFDGARKLVAAVGLPFKLLAPPDKDVRAWVGSGATRADFEFLADSQTWRYE
jgi:hypothetical protein